MKKIIARLSSVMLASAIILTGIAPTTTFAAAESKTNPVVSLSAEYDNGVLIVGNKVKKTNFDVTGTKKDGTTQDITSFTIKNAKITSESQSVTISYKNKAGDAVTTKVPVKAITDFRKINASLNSGVSLDNGSSITKDMFTVKAVLSNGKEKVLANDAFSLSTNKYDGTSTSMNVTVSATNAAKKELKKSVKVTADKAVTKIKAAYNGDDKDVGDSIEPSDFTVTGTTVGKKSVEVKDISLETTILEKNQNTVKVIYTNSFGKELKTTVKVPANKLIEKITKVEYIGGTKNVGDSLTQSDFKVTGQNVKKEQVDITDFDISDETLPREKSSIKITYTNKAGKALTKSVSVSAYNLPESMTVSRRSTKDIYVGDTIRPSDFMATLTYHDGSTKNISGSKLSFNRTDVRSANDTFSVTYTDAKSGVTLSAIVTIDSKNTTVTDGAYAQYVGAAKSVGDSVEASDFKVYVRDTSGMTVEASDVKISGSTKITSSTQSFKLTYTCTDGTKGTVNCSIFAGDDITGIEVTDGSGVSAYGEGTKISKANIEKVISVYAILKSGDKEELTRFIKKGVKVYAAVGGQELTGTGSMTLTAKKASNGIVVKYGSYTETFYIDPDFMKIDQKIIAASSSLTMTVGDTKTLSALVTGEKTEIVPKSSSTSIVTVTNGKLTAKKAGTATITLYCKAATVDGKKYDKSNTVSIKVIVKAKAASTSHKPATTAKKANTITASNQTMKVGASKTVSLIASAKTTVTASSSNSSIVAVSGGKLVAKKAGTAKITITAKESTTYKSATKTITVTVKKKK